MMLRLLIPPVVAAFSLASPATAQDVAGSKDPALLPRFEGAEIRQYRQPSLDRIVIPTAKVSNEANPAGSKHFEGDVAHIDYVINPAIAPLAAARHYRAALTETGYDIVFACSGEVNCGPGMASLILNSGSVAPSGFADGIFSDRIQVIIARQGNDWVLMHANSGPDRAHVYVATVAGASASK